MPADFPAYRLITTQHVRNLQEQDIETPFDATFVHCDTLGGCQNWYNVSEHFRGATSLNQLPHSFRIDLPGDEALDSETAPTAARRGRRPGR